MLQLLGVYNIIFIVAYCVLLLVQIVFLDVDLFVCM